MKRAAASLVLSLAFLSGCTADPFDCKFDHARCTSFPQGQCMGFGGASYCAYPDPPCTPGPRWSSSADPVIAGRCLLTETPSPWEAVQTGIGYNLRAVSGAGGVMFAVGEGRLIVKSTDGGRSWIQQSVNGSPELVGVWARSPNIAYAVGRGLVLRTDDGGRTWIEVFVDPGDRHLFSVFGSGLEYVYALGDSGRILYYDGKAWTPKSSPRAVKLCSGWAAGTDLVIVGGDGTIVGREGSVFVERLSGTSDTLTSVWGVAPTWIGGTGMGLFRSIDTVSWTPVLTNRVSDVAAVWGDGRGEVYVLMGPQLLHSYDSGGTWNTEWTRARRKLFAIGGDGSGSVVIVGEGGAILRRQQ